MPKQQRTTKQRKTTQIIPERKQQVIITLIEYRCAPEDLNMEEVLDKLREMGAADVISTRVEDGRI